MKRTLWAIVAATVALAQTPSAPTLSELLQKAIYTQETLGDLDGAIRLYRQVLDSGRETRALSAQAQYRLGMCLLKRGDTAGAADALKTLIQIYPDQTELVAKAKEALPAGGDLLPAPWTDGDVYEMRLKIPSGATVGTTVHSIHRTAPDAWRIRSRTYAGWSVMWTEVDVDAATMRPLASRYHMPGLVMSRLAYTPSQVRVELEGKSPLASPIESGTYDNDEFVHVMRRLPLAAGYKAEPRVITGMGVPLALKLEVQALEEVTVPAGTFKAWKVNLMPVNQTFWISADASRLFVRMEAMGVTGELISARRADGAAPVLHRDRLGYSLTAPKDWLVQINTAGPANETSTQILDPDAETMVSIWAGAQKREPAKFDSDLRSDAEAKIESRKKILQNYTPRPSSLQSRIVNGQAGFTMTADYREHGRAMAEYLTYAINERVKVLVIVRTEASRLDAIRPRIDGMIATLKLEP